MHADEFENEKGKCVSIVVNDVSHVITWPLLVGFQPYHHLPIPLPNPRVLFFIYLYLPLIEVIPESNKNKN